jgi:peptidoglycan/xylan/chitin deacetylase (PgdA/CDA1 family)
MHGLPVAGRGGRGASVPGPQIAAQGGSLSNRSGLGVVAPDQSLPDAQDPIPEIIRSWDGAEPVVHLTIDDWFDRDMVERSLDVARAERVPLTFFPIGRLVAANADLVLRAAREGHEIENHTFHHQRLDSGHIPPDRIPAEIELQREALLAILGPSYRQQFLRPPGGFGVFGTVNPFLIAAAEGAGLRIAMWSTDAEGWKSGRRSDPAAVAASEHNVLAGLRPGAIVLEHAIPADVLGLEDEIRVAKEYGLRILRLADGLPPLPISPAAPSGDGGLSRTGAAGGPAQHRPGY